MTKRKTSSRLTLRQHSRPKHSTDAHSLTLRQPVTRGTRDLVAKDNTITVPTLQMSKLRHAITKKIGTTLRYKHKD